MTNLIEASSEKKEQEPRNKKLIMDDFLESLKDFDTTIKQDENTQINGKIFENYVKEKLISHSGSLEINLPKKKGRSRQKRRDSRDGNHNIELIYEKLLSDIRKNIKTIEYIQNVYNKLPLRKIVVQQPYGSQSSPDLLLVNITKEDIYFQPIEVKTGKKVATWNNTYPVNGWIYIFHGEKGVTYFHGESVITEEDRNLFEKYKEMRKALTKEFNEKLKEVGSTWKLTDYYKFEHTSGVDYMKDPKKCEEHENDVNDLLNSFAYISILTDEKK